MMPDEGKNTTPSVSRSSSINEESLILEFFMRLVWHMQKTGDRLNVFKQGVPTEKDVR